MITNVYLRCNRYYVKKNGMCALYLLVGVNNQFEKVPLKLEWPPAMVDEDEGRVLRRQKNDPDANDYNLIIRTEMGKFNEIFKRYRLADKEISLKIALSEYKVYGKRNDFLAYMADKILSRNKTKEISDASRASQMSSMRMFRRFVAGHVLKVTSGKGMREADKVPESVTMPAAEMTPGKLKEFEQWLRSRPNGRGGLMCADSVAKHMTVMRTYVDRAYNDGVLRVHAVKEARKDEKVNFSQTGGRTVFLEPDEYQEILSYYERTSLSLKQRIWLLRFLIACETGARLGDIKKIRSVSEVNGYVRRGEFEYLQGKGIRYRQKWVRVPIDETTGRHLLEHALCMEKLSDLRGNVCDQKGNEYLKHLADKLGIDKKLSFHIGRHTMGTNYMRAGGQLLNLMEVLGQTTIRSTLKYTHSAQADIRKETSALRAFMSRRKVLSVKPMNQRRHGATRRRRA